jgi:hypothetical protein
MTNINKVYCILQCYEDTSIVLGVTNSKAEIDKIMKALEVVQEKYQEKLDWFIRQDGKDPNMQWYYGRYDSGCLKEINLFTEDESALLGWLDNGEFVKKFYIYIMDCFEATESVVFKEGE